MSVASVRSVRELLADAYAAYELSSQASEVDPQEASSSDFSLVSPLHSSSEDDGALALIPLTAENLNAHTRRSTATERRMFVCERHGVFWKKVPVGGNKSNGQAVAGCSRCGPANTTKLLVLPREEERGKGLFECSECGNVWTSNSACRKLAQYCWAEGCSRAERQEATFPGDIRTVDPPWLRARNRARNRGGADDPGSDGGFEALDPIAEEGTAPPSSGPALRVPPGGRKHHCSGCATGACKLEPPPSRLHVPSGSTCPTLSDKTWSTIGSEWSDGSVRTDRSPANRSRSRRRRFYAGGNAAGSAQAA